MSLRCRTSSRANHIVLHPYARQELIQVGQFVEDAPMWARLDLETLFCLGLGAGLSDIEATRITGRHVHIDRRGVLLDIDESIAARSIAVRLVPVLDNTAWKIVAAMRRSPDGPLVQPENPERRGLVRRLVRQVPRDDDVPVLSMHRLRSSWIAWHLEHKTPLANLAEAAGLRYGALAPYYAEVNAVDYDEARDHLHGHRP